MRRNVITSLGIVGIAALALTGCQAADPTGSDSAAADAPITIATIPMSDDPTAENPVDVGRTNCLDD